jgi:hypothetical protein
LKSYLKQSFIYTFFLLTGCFALLIGMAFPFYFRGIAPELLQKAGSESMQIATLSDQLIDYGRISPVFEFKHVVPDLEVDDRLYHLAKENSDYFYSGGSAPYLEEIVRRLSIEEGNFVTPTTVTELLTPPQHRAYLSDFLSRSRNSNVREILGNAEMKGTVVFSPVSSAAGTPLEISILTTALLIQAEEIPRSFASDLADVAYAANQGQPRAVEQMENVYLAVLSLGKRFQWVSLCELMRNINSLEEMLRMAAVFRQYPSHRSLLFSVFMLHETPSNVFDFMELYGKESLKDFETSVQAGRGSLELLFDRASPIYRPKSWLAHFQPIQDLILETPIYRVALTNPTFTGILKLMFLFSAGLCFIILARLAINRTSSNYRGWVAGILANMGNIAMAAAFAVIVWLTLEPEFLKQSTNTASPLSIQFATANPFTNLKNDVMNNMEIDQVTLLILGLFFILQVSIYAYARVRLQEIKKMEVSSETKLRLIDNEENLFDSGLYVGLGGTVASLIMLALKIVEASLMAAYASTLFGIIFVAVLKIFSVRPYRNTLILAAKDEETPKSPTRQKQLKLK